jgi:hypothetical protein
MRRMRLGLGGGGGSGRAVASSVKQLRRVSRSQQWCNVMGSDVLTGR